MLLTNLYCYQGIYRATISQQISCLLLMLRALLRLLVSPPLMSLLLYCCLHHYEETLAFSLIAPLHGSKTRQPSSSSSLRFATSSRITDSRTSYLSSTKLHATLRDNIHSSNANNKNKDENNDEDGDNVAGVRLNKAFQATHSRRQADGLIQEGRVCVNGVKPNTMGVRLFPGDVVTLDNVRVYWEHRPTVMNRSSTSSSSSSNGGGGSSTVADTTMRNHHHHHRNNNRRDDHDALSTQQSRRQSQLQQQHTYIKYWKPRGVECTTDRRVRNNIIDALGEIPGVEHRLWPMGRLDKDSTGLILLTSDGTTTQRVLKSSNSDDESGSSRRHWKTYWVETDQRATDQDLQKLSQGVRILAPTSRDGNNKIQWVTTRTDATITRRFPSMKTVPKNDNNNSNQKKNQYKNNDNNYSMGTLQNQLIFTICEGKNRQIRRMCETVGLTVVKLHRVEFAGITLDRCNGPGSWVFLTKEEVDLLVLFQDDDNKDDNDL